MLVRSWSNDVILCTDGDVLTSEQFQWLDRAGIGVRDGEVACLETTYARLRGVLFADGLLLERRMVFVAFTQRLNSELGAQLGCRQRDGDFCALDVDASGATGRSGVWAKWWRGVDSPGEQNPTAMDTTPGMLLDLMRPVEDD